jgi:hypothetical protein
MESKLACAAAMMAASLLGCSVHIQAPIKEVAYDFSDRDFYDRGYAPSPDYGASPAAIQPRIEPAPPAAPAPQPADSARRAPPLQ